MTFTDEDNYLAFETNKWQGFSMETLFWARRHFKVVFVYFCCLMSQSTTMVMSSRSVNFSTLFLGRFRPKRLTSSAHPFASNW